MKTTTEDIQEVFNWMAKLDAGTLFAAVSVDSSSGTFASDNWNNLGAFVEVNSPAETAQIILSRKEADAKEVLMGASYYHGTWAVMNIKQLQSIHQVDPKTLEVRPVKDGVSFALLNEAYPDCPIKVLAVLEVNLLY